jgi:hypothetical protein
VLPSLLLRNMADDFDFDTYVADAFANLTPELPQQSSYSLDGYVSQQFETMTPEVPVADGASLPDTAPIPTPRPANLDPEGFRQTALVPMPTPRPANLDPDGYPQLASVPLPPPRPANLDPEGYRQLADVPLPTPRPANLEDLEQIDPVLPAVQEVLNTMGVEQAAPVLEVVREALGTIGGEQAAPVLPVELGGDLGTLSEATPAPVTPVESKPLPAPGPARTIQGYLGTKLAPGKDIAHVENLDGGFKTSLGQLIASAPPEIAAGLQVGSGYRSVERQRELWEAAVKKYGSPEAARKWVAPPGNSQHNLGRAVDLWFNGQRLDKAPAHVRKWVHENAAKFGLHFPLGNEAWHIEPKWARQMAYAPAPTRITDIITSSARETGADGEFLKRIAYAESKFNPSLQAKTSSAGGLFQFIDGTWKEYVSKYGSLYGVPGASKFDPRAASLMAGKLAADNYAALERELGRKPNAAEQYAAWVFGRGGGPQFVRAYIEAPSAPGVSAVDPKAVAANRSIFFEKTGAMRTNAGVYAELARRIGGTEIQVAQAATTVSDATLLNSMSAVQPTTFKPDYSARTDPKASISPHDVWSPPPVNLDSRYTDAAIEAARFGHREQGMGFWSGLGNLLTTKELTARGVRALTSKGYVPDESYVGSPQQALDLESLSAGLPQSYVSRFGSAVSQPHMVEIARQAQAEHSLMTQLSQAGWKGTAAQITAALIDPASLTVGVMSGGLGAGIGNALKMGQIGSRLTAGAAGAAGNVGIEFGLNSLAGQESETSQLAIAAAMGFGFGAVLGPLGRNRALSAEAIELERLGHQMSLEPVPLPMTPVRDWAAAAAAARQQADVMEGGAQVGYLTREERQLHLDAAAMLRRNAAEMDKLAGAPNSAGAAANLLAVPEALSDPVFRAMQQGSAPATAITRGRLSEGGKAAASQNPIVRMLGGMLGVDTVGKAGLGVNPISADQEMVQYFRPMTANWRSVANPAYDEWATAQGYNFFERRIGRGWGDFNDQVSAYVRNTDSLRTFDAAVSRAGEHFRKLMKQMAEDQQNPWVRKNGKLGGSVAGAEGLTPDPNYVMRVWSVSKLNNAIAKFGHPGVRRVVAAAIKNKQTNIDDDLAEKFADAILNSRFTRAMGYDDRLSGAIGNADTAKLADMFRNEFGWSEDDIRRLLAQLRHTEPNQPPHLKHRIQLDENHFLDDVNGFGTGRLSIADLLENNADLLMNYYSRKVAGEVALARQRFVNPVNGDVVVDGIKSDADFEKIVRHAQQWFAQNGLAGDDAKKAIDGLRWMYDRIKGRPDPASLNEWADWLRVAKNYNFARMMGQIGFAQMMDVGRIVGTLGVKSFFSQMRGFRRVVDTNGQAVLKHGMDHELEAMFGLGTDRLRGFAALVWDDAGQVRGASRGRAVDKAANATEFLASVTGEVSGMHYINSWLQLMVGRAAAQKFANLATSKLSKSDLRYMRFLGLDDDMLNRVLAQVNQKFTHESGFLFGKRVAKMNLDQWTDLEARSAFEGALFRWSRHIVQENDIGSLHRMMSHPIAQTLMQFRSYAMTAWENQLLHGLAARDGRTFAQFTASMISGAMVYAVQTNLQALGRSDADKFLEEKFSPHKFGAAVFQRAGFSSLLPMIIDSAAVFTPAGPVFDARPSGQSTDFIFGNPFFSLINDAQKTTRTIMQRTWDGKEMSQPELRQMARTMFLQNTMPIIQGYSLLIGDQPEKNRR